LIVRGLGHFDFCSSSGPLELRVVHSEKPEVDSTARPPDGANRRSEPQAQDVPHRHSAAGVPLQPVIEPDRRRARRGVFARESDYFSAGRR